MSQGPVVVVLRSGDPPPGMDEVERLGDARYVSDAELPSEIESADALLMWDFRSRALGRLDRLPERLRWIHVAGAGVDPALVPAVVSSPVVLTNSRGVFDRSIAEYVAGLIFLYAKDVPRTLDLQRAREWRHRETEMVAGRTALVVGSGPIGRSIAELLRAIGLEVTLAGRTARPGIAPSSSLPELLPAADFVVVAAPLTRETEGLFDKEMFALMRPEARFVNIGRGGLVVEPDLIAALSSGQIAGAALDVFATEPLPPDSPLWSMPGVIVSPHMSADFVGWLDALAGVFVENFRRFVADRPLLNVVDKELGYVPSAE